MLQEILSTSFLTQDLPDSYSLLKKFGKSGIAHDMYARGKFSVQRSWRLPFLPTIGKRGRKDRSKPVAQIMESTSITSPVAISTPLGAMLTMVSVTTRTFALVKDSRYPGPGVSLRQPTGKVGMRYL
jgi:hypothetical protein